MNVKLSFGFKVVGSTSFSCVLKTTISSMVNGETSVPTNFVRWQTLQEAVKQAIWQSSDDFMVI